MTSGNCAGRVEWRDIAILLRSPRGRSEIFAKEFERAGIPLAVARGGFYQSAEILDLLSLLQLLDNPLQDVPCLAVLRSPLVGLSLDELAEIRLAAREKHFWTALNRSAEQGLPNAGNPGENWRIPGTVLPLAQPGQQVSLSQCLEEMLAETLYADWLRAQPRGAQRAANVAGFLQLARQFDQFQRQGLFRFLKFIEAQQAVEAEPEVPAAAAGNAVRLMSIHQSKGLEFPVVVLADLAKPFNELDLRSEIIFDEDFGLCPKIKPPQTGGRYPSLPHWLAQRRQRREGRGEELRLLYVAMTRARDQLILTASITEKSWEEKWTAPQPVSARSLAAAKFFADWLALWFAHQRPTGAPEAQSATSGALENLRLAGRGRRRVGRPRRRQQRAIGNRQSAIANRTGAGWRQPRNGSAAGAARMDLSVCGGHPLQGQILGHSLAAGSGRTGRRGGTVFRATTLSTAGRAEQRRRPGPTFGGGNRGGASQIHAARRAGPDRSTGRRGGAAGAGKLFIAGRAGGPGFGRAGRVLEFGIGPQHPGPGPGGAAGDALHGAVQSAGAGANHRAAGGAGIGK